MLKLCKIMVDGVSLSCYTDSRDLVFLDKYEIATLAGENSLKSIRKRPAIRLESGYLVDPISIPAVAEVLVKRFLTRTDVTFGLMKAALESFLFTSVSSS
jgi:hypothetical protein